jgi:CRISPR-associated exonuclease Cas4
VEAGAAAEALAWERQAPVGLAVVEVPAHGIVRRVPLDGRRRAEYRRTLRTVRRLEGVPPRLTDRSKCGACEYRETCGVTTRTLGSLLG